jgi:hypothetical protein
MAPANAGALAFSLTCVFQRWAAVPPSGPAPNTSGMVRSMVRATARAGVSPPAASWSRRRLSWVTAASTHAEAPGKSPASSSTTSRGVASAPRPARGMGMSSGSGTTGACQVGASSRSRPPRLTTTMRAPAVAAAWAASIVSSVSPENDTAKHRVPGPTKAGTVYPLLTTMGTGTNDPPAAASTSPATPLPPMPSTTTLSMASCSGSPPMPAARRAASSTCSGNPAVAANMPRESSTGVDAGLIVNPRPRRWDRCPARRPWS